MMNQAGYRPWVHKLLWCEAAQAAADIDNILVLEHTNDPPFTRFYGNDAKYRKYLQTFGKMCVTAQNANKQTRTKVDPQGWIGIFVGYSTVHAGDVYCFIHSKANQIILQC